MIDNGPRLVPNTATPKVTSEDVAVAANSVAYSAPWRLIDLSSFALEYKVACTGTPSVKLEIQQRSSESIDWYTPENVADIISNITDTDQHGRQLSQLTTIEFLRIKVTELTTTVNDTVVTLGLSGQKRYAA